MIHLFIDTNIFLSFYRFNDEQLHRLVELVTLVKTKKVKLYLTDQVIDEFNRNRENVFKETIKQMNDFVTKFPTPVLTKEMREVKSILTHLKHVDRKKKRVMERLKRQFKYNSLKIDKIMKELISLGQNYPVSDVIYEKGLRRYNLGNPPGKKNSYGDAMNWEILLESVPNRKPLYFVGADGDYISPLESSNFSYFLRVEWKKQKGSSVILFNSILEFLKVKNPQSKVTPKEIEQEKKNSNPLQILYYDSLINNYNNPLKVTFENPMKFLPPIIDYEDISKLSSLYPAISTNIVDSMMEAKIKKDEENKTKK